MDTQQLIDFLNQKILQVDTIIEFSETVDYPKDWQSFFSSVHLTKTYLSRIVDDLRQSIVPQSFFPKIFHNIQSIDLDEIYSVCDQKDEGNRIVHLNIVIPQTELNVHNLYTTYIFFSDLNFVSDHTVIVGANGSGKSSLASTLKATIDERDGIVIPAQKLLIVPTFDNIPNYSSTSLEYDVFQKDYKDGKSTYNASRSADIPYEDTQRYGAEFKYVIKTLLAERGYLRNAFCDNYMNGEKVAKEALESKLDKAIEIWNDLVEHRAISCDKSNNLIIRDKESEETYPAHKMSDGEKNILYLIGRILLSPQGALILVDEPEMYLHKSIVNKLWDRLETGRQDCTFVYLTHDLDFASSRKAKKYWIKQFTYPNKWDILPIPQNEIPESLLMMLLGSRKKILFCEGKNSSLDIKIFESLFQNYTIAPVEGCTDVINYVRAFNKIGNKNAQAIGIIDRDFRLDVQLEKLKAESIFSYSVAEVENLFLIKEFISCYVDSKNETINLSRLEDKVFKLLKKDRETQVSNYLSSYLNYNFKESHVRKGNTLSEVQNHLEEFNKNLDIDGVYEKRNILIDEIIREKNYDLAIKIYNNKGLLICVEDLLGLKPSNYRNKALEFLKYNDEAKKILKNSFELSI